MIEKSNLLTPDPTIMPNSILKSIKTLKGFVLRQKFSAKPVGLGLELGEVSKITVSEDVLFASEKGPG